jgi:hypothetical protein
MIYGAILTAFIVNSDPVEVFVGALEVHIRSLIEDAQTPDFDMMRWDGDGGAQA